MTPTEPSTEPRITYTWPHLRWERYRSGYRCQTCRQFRRQPVALGCPGRQGRPEPQDRVEKERA